MPTRIQEAESQNRRLAIPQSIVESEGGSKRRLALSHPISDSEGTTKRLVLPNPISDGEGETKGGKGISDHFGEEAQQLGRSRLKIVVPARIAEEVKQPKTHTLRVPNVISEDDEGGGGHPTIGARAAQVKASLSRLPRVQLSDPERLIAKGDAAERQSQASRGHIIKEQASRAGGAIVGKLGELVAGVVGLPVLGAKAVGRVAHDAYDERMQKKADKRKRDQEAIHIDLSSDMKPSHNGHEPVIEGEFRRDDQMITDNPIRRLMSDPNYSDPLPIKADKSL